ncbi:Septin-domain-containing protein [Limtongia smithiae]|uniref:Septin-domain-containing protein n=1 Tax=Limtongia smithiae TaxID=1125753 RepID=UPI0034CF3D12
MATAESLQPRTYVGFDTITRQIEKKMLKRGFQLNVMVVGQSGLGKSTLINTIFSSHLADSRGRRSPIEPVRQTTEVTPTSHVIEENGVRLKLNIVDTPGYADKVNNDRCWEPIVKYIKDQHMMYLRKELTAQRDRFINDTRVHCLLFFIAPTGHSLKTLDITVLKKLADITNVVPVIAKSDALTLEERAAFKARIHEEFAAHHLKMYPYDSDLLDEDERAMNTHIRAMLPFAVVGSENDIVVDGKVVRGRKSRWGVVNVENENHCEFISLRNFLTRTHLQDLIDSTSQVHYENFRSKQLLAMRDNGTSSSSSARPISPASNANLAGTASSQAMEYGKPSGDYYSSGGGAQLDPRTMVH